MKKSKTSSESSASIEGGCIWHEEPVPPAIRLRVLKELLAKWLEDYSDMSWQAECRLEDEIDRLENSKS